MKYLPFSQDSHTAPPLRIELPFQVQGHADLLCRCIFFLKIDPDLSDALWFCQDIKQAGNTHASPEQCLKSSWEVGSWASSQLAQIKLFSKGFPGGGSGQRSLLPIQGIQVESLVQEDPHAKQHRASQWLKAEGRPAPQEEKQAQWTTTKVSEPLQRVQFLSHRARFLRPHTPSESWKTQACVPIHQVTSDIPWAGGGGIRPSLVLLQPPNTDSHHLLSLFLMT